MSFELYNRDGHVCLMFSDLHSEGGEAVQANQFLIVNGDTGAILDPGGNLAYGELYLAMSRFFHPSKLSAIVASHADPDIIASLDRWMTGTPAKVYISTVWERFVPHFCKPGKTTDRIIGIPDEGGIIRIGKAPLVALPAHFLHAEGNFQFYDPIAKILFSGDLGVSLGTGQDAMRIVTDIEPLKPSMERFHRRYMVSNKILRLWAQMIRTLDIQMIVPQHGCAMAGPAVQQFIDWISTMSCGIDLMDDRNYQVPAGWQSSGR